MDAIRVIAVLLMIAAVLVVVTKKFSVPTSFLSIGFIVMLVMTAVTGQSVLSESVSGNPYIDIFEVMANAITSSLGSTGLVIMVVMGYVAYMKQIKASDLFSMLCARPLRKLKNNNILIFAVFVLTVVVKLAIPSSSSEVALLIATVFPIMLAVGISRQTVAAVLLVSSSIVWGPSNTLALTAFNGAGLEDISIPVYFVTKEVIPVIGMTVVGAVVFIIVNRYFDKKEGVLADRDKLPELPDASQLGIPRFYAVFPLLPVILLIIFSPVIQKNVTISVVAANFLCFVLVLVIETIRKRKVKEVFDDSQALYKGMGQAFVNVVAILIGVNVFSAAMNAVGGLKVLANLLAGGGSGSTIIAVVGAVAGMLLVGVGSSISGTIPLFSSLYAGFVSSQAELINMCRMLIFGASLGSVINPISPTMVIVTGGCDVPVTNVIKRSLIPRLACLLTEIIICILIP